MARRTASVPGPTRRRVWRPLVLVLVAGLLAGCRTQMGDGDDRVGDYDEAKLREWLEFAGDKNTTRRDIDEIVSDFAVYCTGSFAAQRAAIVEQHDLAVELQRIDDWWFTYRVLEEACPQRAEQLLDGLEAP